MLTLYNEVTEQVIERRVLTRGMAAAGWVVLEGDAPDPTPVEPDVVVRQEDEDPEAESEQDHEGPAGDQE